MKQAPMQNNLPGIIQLAQEKPKNGLVKTSKYFKWGLMLGS